MPTPIEADFLAAHPDWPYVLRVTVPDHAVPSIIAEDYIGALVQTYRTGDAEVHVIHDGVRATIYLLLRDPEDVGYMRFFNDAAVIVRNRGVG